ncbi:MAG: RasGEF domain-containing protein, partial [archaeon]|nr:RasGEF domain-containing protein [archaeon]
TTSSSSTSSSASSSSLDGISDPFPLSHYFADPPITGFEINLLTTSPLHETDIAHLHALFPSSSHSPHHEPLSLRPDTLFFLSSGSLSFSDSLSHTSFVLSRPGWLVCPSSAFPIRHLSFSVLSQAASIEIPFADLSSILATSATSNPAFGLHNRFWLSVLLSSIDLWTLRLSSPVSSGSSPLPPSPPPAAFADYISPSFAPSFSPSDMRSLIRVCKRKAFKSDDTLISKGDLSSYYYILLSGECSCEFDAVSPILTDAGPSLLGCLLTGLPACASVRVTSHTAEMLVLNIRDLHALIKRDPSFLSKFYTFCLETTSFFSFTSLPASPSPEAISAFREALWCLPLRRLLRASLEESAQPLVALPAPVPLQPPHVNASSLPEHPKLPSALLKSRMDAVLAGLSLAPPEPTLRSFPLFLSALFNADQPVNGHLIMGMISAIHCFPEPIDSILATILGGFPPASNPHLPSSVLRCLHILSQWIAIRPIDFAVPEKSPSLLLANDWVDRWAHLPDLPAVYSPLIANLKSGLAALVCWSPSQTHFAPRNAVSHLPGFSPPSYRRCQVTSPRLWDAWFGVSFETCDTVAIARAIACMDHHLLCRVAPSEFFQDRFKDASLPLAGLLEFRHNLTRWIVSLIVLAGSASRCAALISKCITIGNHLLTLNDFHGLAGFSSALYDPDIRSLNAAWAEVAVADRKTCDQLRLSVHRQQNYKLYYSHLRSITKSSTGFVLLPEHIIQNIAHLESKLRDQLSFLSDQTPPGCSRLERFQQIGGLLDIVSRSQLTAYTFSREIDPILITCFCSLDPLLETKTIHSIARKMVNVNPTKEK